MTSSWFTGRGPRGVWAEARRPHLTMRETPRVLEGQPIDKDAATTPATEGTSSASRPDHRPLPRPRQRLGTPIS